MLLDEMKMNIILSASRSLPGQVPKKLELGSSFSQSGDSLVSVLVVFSIIGGTLGALGANFSCPKAVRATKGVPRGATPEIKSFFGTDVGVIFLVFFDFLASVFKHCCFLSSGAVFSWILVSFRHHLLIFLYN